tara:strand:- start:4368 stop:4838 length:471 start_codon:yes stop_codon:yes gene_type:complete
MNCKLLNIKDFKNVILNTPLISIDLIIKNTKGEVLLGERTNEPAKGFLFVPGGRILKNETIPLAFERIINTELDYSYDFNKAKFLGVFEHFYDNSFLDSSISTHYIVLAYEVFLNLSLYQLPLEQHKTFSWATIDEVFQSDKVHTYSKNYFYKVAN